MPSFALRYVALAMMFSVAGSALVGPADVPFPGKYPSSVKMISGVAAVAGSVYLSRAISLTLLRSGGTMAFRAAYVAAAALGGLGLAEALSAFWPVNMGHALATYCVIAVGSGALWVRFYGRAA
jgi:hypothetical protein